MLVGALTLLAFAACGGGEVFMSTGLSPDLARTANAAGNASIRINVLLNTGITDAIRAEIGSIGRIRGFFGFISGYNTALSAGTNLLYDFCFYLHMERISVRQCHGWRRITSTTRYCRSSLDP